MNLSKLETTIMNGTGKSSRTNDNDPGSARDRLVEGLDAREALSLKKFSYLYVAYILERCHGNKLRTADVLGMNRRTIQRWVKAKYVTMPTTQRELFVDDVLPTEKVEGACIGCVGLEHYESCPKHTMCL